MKYVSLTILICSFTLFSYSQDSAKKAHIRQMMQASGSGKIGVQLFNNLMDAYKKSQPNVPEEFWDEFSKEVNPEELMELLVPIYDKYFTDAEIQQLNQFYNSPIGKKLTDRLPQISQDSYSSGQEWGRKISEKVISRLKEKGYIKNI